MTSGVYVIAHKPTGNCYVGSSVDVERRWKRHCADLRKGQHHSYKLNVLCLSELAFSLVDVLEKNDLTEGEQRWMDNLDAVKNGLNVCPNASTPSTLPKTAEHKARIGAAHRGMKRSAEARARMSAAMTGIKRGPLPAEVAAKISAANKGRKRTEEVKRNLSLLKKGVKTGPCSDSRRLAISVAKRKRDAAALAEKLRVAL